MAHHENSIVRPTVLFVLGASFGAVVGFWLVVTVQEPALFFSGIAVCAVAGGVLSARNGIRFWEALRHFRWFGL